MDFTFIKEIRKKIKKGENTVLKEVPNSVEPETTTKFQNESFHDPVVLEIKSDTLMLMLDEVKILYSKLLDSIDYPIQIAFHKDAIKHIILERENANDYIDKFQKFFSKEIRILSEEEVQALIQKTEKEEELIYHNCKEMNSIERLLLHDYDLVSIICYRNKWYLYTEHTDVEGNEGIDLKMPIMNCPFCGDKLELPNQ